MDKHRISTFWFAFIISLLSFLFFLSILSFENYEDKGNEIDEALKEIQSSVAFAIVCMGSVEQQVQGIMSILSLRIRGGWQDDVFILTDKPGIVAELLSIMESEDEIVKATVLRFNNTDYIWEENPGLNSESGYDEDEIGVPYVHSMVKAGIMGSLGKKIKVIACIDVSVLVGRDVNKFVSNHMIMPYLTGKYLASIFDHPSNYGNSKIWGDFPARKYDDGVMVFFRGDSDGFLHRIQKILTSISPRRDIRFKENFFDRAIVGTGVHVNRIYSPPRGLLWYASKDMLITRDISIFLKLENSPRNFQSTSSYKYDLTEKELRDFYSRLELLEYYTQLLNILRLSRTKKL